MGSIATLPLGVSGTGVPPIYLGTNTLAFGNEGVGVPSAQSTVYLFNYSGKTQSPGFISSSGAFVPAAGTCSSVPTNTSCHFTVTFTPPGLGLVTGSISVQTPGNADVPLAVSGTGVPQASLGLSSLTFGTQGVGSSSALKSVTVYNYSGSAQPLTINSASSAFLVGMGTCGSSLPNNTGCYITVTFAPTDLGLVTSSVSVQVGSIATLPLGVSGTGVPPLYLGTTTLAFGNEGVGIPSASKTVTFYNYSGSSLTPVFTPSGPYAVIPGGPCSLPVSSGGSCNFAVTFTPTAQTSQPGSITVSSGSLTPATLTLSGTGVPQVYLSATTLAFGNEGVGIQSALRTVTFYNYSGGPITPGFTPTGPYAVTGGCGAVVPTNTNCSFTVAFTPTAQMSQPGSISVSVGSSYSPLTLTMSGTGVPQVYLSATTLAFGNEGVGIPSALRTVTFYNYSGGPITPGFTPTGPYAVTGGCGAVVPINTSCSFTVAFTPTAQASQPGSISVSAGSSFTPLTLTMSGTGVAPVYLGMSSLAFGNEGVGIPSASMVTFYNYSGVTQSPGFTSSSGAFVPAAGACSSVLTNTSCTFTVTFTPPGIGLVTGSISVQTLGYADLPLAVSGTGVAQVSLGASSLAFGNEGVGVPSALKSVTVYNYSGGSQPLVINSTSTAFIVGAGTCGVSLPNNTNCYFTVTFQPTNVGPVTPTPSVSVQVGSFAPMTVALSGTGVPPLYLSPTTLAFGSEGVGIPSASKTVTFYNYSGGPLTPVFTPSGPYAVIPGGPCSVPVPAGGNCNFAVTFTPTAQTSQPGSITVSSGSLTPATLTLSGTGVAQVYLSTTTLAFGNEGVGIQSALRTVTFYNYSGGPITPGFTPTGPYAVTGGCGAVVPTNTNCSFTVAFTPTAQASQPGSISVSAGSSYSPLTLTMSGTGVPLAYLNVSTLAFGNEGVGIPSASKTVTIYNYSGGTQTLGVAPSGSGAFTTASGTCGSTLANNSSCNFTVSFNPSSLGSAAGSLTITVGSVAPITLPMTGNGVAQAYLNASSLSFGTVGIGQSSAPRAVVFYNYTGAPLAPTFGTLPAGFTLAPGACSNPVPINSNCTFTVTFSPTVIGSAGGSLSVTPGGLSALNLNLSGNAVAPDYLSVTSLTFGSQTHNTSSAPRTVTFYNYSGGALTPSIQAPSPAGAFTTAVGTCTGPVNTGSSCNFTVTFRPPTTGPFSASLSVSTGAFPDLGLALNGTGK